MVGTLELLYGKRKKGEGPKFAEAPMGLIISGVGGQMDFIRGASLSEGGKPVIALTSRTKKGAPRIVPRDNARRSMATDLLKRAFGGSPALMMATLMDSDAVSNKELKRL